MKNLSKICVTASPVQALGKLKRADIPVYNCVKEGAYFTFEVADNYIKKVFAIFAHPCYNVIVKQNSKRKRLIKLAFARPCLILGAMLFAVCAAASNSFLFKICVTGSGGYLENEVLAIVYSLGVSPYRIYRGIDEPSLIAEVMALPCVTFCSAKKSGSVLYIDVQVQKESGKTADYSSLYSDVNGRIAKIAAVCGTAEVKEGDEVKKGDLLIGAYCGEEKASCLAAGYAEIEVNSVLSVFFEEESEQSLDGAYASVMLYAENDEIISRSVTIKTVADGVIYTVNFTHLHTISINFD
ncbi:MAG: sporulation protein YqfD [Clostridia bacterium]|nr:sporulation protein YqfD [Clostridia bacterium]